MVWGVSWYKSSDQLICWTGPTIKCLGLNESPWNALLHYNTDVELVWGGGWGGVGLHSHPITRHTEEAFVRAGATLSAPLFWLSLHAPVPQQIHVCEGFECNVEVTLRKAVSLTKCFSLSFFFFLEAFCWPVIQHLQPWSFSSPFIWQCQTWWSMDFIVLLLSSIEFSVVILNGRNNCLRGCFKLRLNRANVIQGSQQSCSTFIMLRFILDHGIKLCVMYLLRVHVSRSE